MTNETEHPAPDVYNHFAVACPFCDSLEVDVQMTDMVYKHFAVACSNCGAVGPTVVQSEYQSSAGVAREAVERWNGFTTAVDIALGVDNAVENHLIDLARKISGVDDPPRPEHGDLPTDRTDNRCEEVPCEVGVIDDTPDPDLANDSQDEASDNKPDADDSEDEAPVSATKTVKSKSRNRHMLADEIERFLKKRGETPYTCDLGVSDQTVKNILDGVTQNPAATTEQKIRAAMAAAEGESATAWKPPANQADIDKPIAITGPQTAAALVEHEINEIIDENGGDISIAAQHVGVTTNTLRAAWKRLAFPAHLIDKLALVSPAIKTRKGDLIRHLANWDMTA